MTFSILMRSPDSGQMFRALQNYGYAGRRDGEIVTREGVSVVEIPGPGLLTRHRQPIGTADVDQVSGQEFGVRATPPEMGPGVYVERDNVRIGTFTRIQARFSVFTLDAGQTVAVGDTVTAYVPEVRSPGFFAILRIRDEIDDDPANVDDNVKDLPPEEQEEAKARPLYRSKIVRFIKANGVQGIEGGNTYYEHSGTDWRIRFYDAKEVRAWLASRGVVMHSNVGGNVY